MKLIDFDFIRKLGITPLQCYNWVEKILRNKDHVILPPKISMKMDNHAFYNVMPCIIPENNVMGVKVISRLPSRGADVPGLKSHIMLYEMDSGELIALVDGNYITAIRTASVAVHSLKLFAIRDFRNIGIIGLGITATATFDIFLKMFPSRQLNVKLLKYKEQAEHFINRYQAFTNIKFSICNNAEAVIRNSDIVLSCVTYAESNFADDACYKEGCTVIPIHTLGFQNCDLFFDKVYGDDTGHIKGFKYFDRFKRYAEVSDVVLGRAAGREDERERIIIYNIGLAMYDIYLANKYYQVSDEAPDVSFSQPTRKMWLCKFNS